MAGATAMWLLLGAFMASSYLRRVRQGAVSFEWWTLGVMVTGGAVGIVVFALHCIPDEA